jgi:hypothetical protein
LEIAASRATADQKGLKIQGRRRSPEAVERSPQRGGGAISSGRIQPSGAGSKYN